MPREMVTIDGNEAAAYVAYKTNEVIAIYPITPSSPMAEHADEWSAFGERNIWGHVPQVIEMESEAGAAGAVHGSLQAGALTTTFTASQGLLLMIPNMFKIAGELTPTVFHIAARTVATHALSIFGDHSDVMATRSTGWAMLFSNSVQEAMDQALIAQAATLEARVPFLHVFDGFRTSHEVHKIEKLAEEDLRALIDDDWVRDMRQRAMSPDRPFVRGTAQNPDVFFQSREAANPFYQAVPRIVQAAMDRFAARVGRQYHLFDYVGAADAERVIVLMGSGAEAAEEAVAYLNGRGEKVGLVKVRLYRPFSVPDFLRALPPTTRAIGVLDRAKEPGAVGEPLYVDVRAALPEAARENPGLAESHPRVVGGRYGLSSKEFTPAMAIGVFENLREGRLQDHFTVGIDDDVSHTSIPYDRDLDIEPADVVRAVFWGLGSDGTVGANKNSIKIIGETTPYHAQGYFVYDSKKAGAHTVSHLRFGPRPIHSTYEIRRAQFVGVHQFGFLERYHVVDGADTGATLLLNSPYEPTETWDMIPRPVQEEIIRKKLRVYAINANDIAAEMGLGNRINTIMQACFFALTQILPQEQAIAKIKESIRQTYGRRGEVIVEKNNRAVDAALARLYEVRVPAQATGTVELPPPVPVEAPEFVQRVTARIIEGVGDRLPVSAMPVDGTWPSGTTRWEKRNLALDVPVWAPEVCIQCGRCSLFCPHGVVRAKVFDESALAGAPPGFKSLPARFREPELAGKRYTIQVSVEDCTGCAVCVNVCPAKDKTAVGRKALNMAPQLAVREEGRAHWAFFRQLPEIVPPGLNYATVRNVQLRQPLFEFHSACAGCGEAPYIRLLSQLFGDRLLIGDATGCTSIYSANLPGMAWGYNEQGRGAAWNNSLFEDNAEFTLGLRLAVDRQAAYARELVEALRGLIGDELADGILGADQSTEEGIAAQRERVARLKERLRGRDHPAARHLESMADALVRRSVWGIGGDGWAYDIGFNGLDHAMASGRNVKFLVVDTEVYSNTGGQSSKSTDLGAVAKFAVAGKRTPKKDLGLMAMTYGYVYVAQVAMGADDAQTVRAFQEAEAYGGPALIIAYSTCIAHGINMAEGMSQEKLAVLSGHWPLYRYDPRRRAEGKNPLQLDSKAPSVPLRDYYYNENRYRMLAQSKPQVAEELLAEAQRAVVARWHKYEQIAAMTVDVGAEAPRPEAAPVAEARR